jgi:hypothetical protein
MQDYPSVPDHCKALKPTTAYLFVVGAGQGMVCVTAWVPPTGLFPAVQEGAGGPVVGVGLGAGHDLHGQGHGLQDGSAGCSQRLCPGCCLTIVI